MKGESRILLRIKGRHMQGILQNIKTRIQLSVIPKMLFIIILVIFLLMPVSAIKDLMYQRSHTRTNAVNEVSRRWGGEQTIGGPVLTIPYLQYERDSRDSIVAQRRTAHFLPAELDIDGRIEPELRDRGIFEVLLYRANLNVRGAFKQPDFSRWHIPSDQILWDEAYVSVNIPDTRGIKKEITLQWNDSEIAFGPSPEDRAIFASEIGAQSPIDGGDSSDISFAFNLQLNGHYSLCILPFGGETSVNLVSTWPHPGFTGEFLPEEHEISDDGFAARWKVNYIERNYPQQWRENNVDTEKFHASSFGVNLVIPADTYHQSIRSVKYAVLFILFSFVAFFLFEVMTGLRIHPVQYVLVGFAVCVFYLLLVSLSEHLEFSLAYLLASLGCVGLIGGYSLSVLTSGRRAGIIAIVMSGLYGMLYVLLQQDEYALLVGSIGMFLILALLMYLTRRIDWYNINKRAEADPDPVQPVDLDVPGTLV